jgi:hypothetical protein
LIRNSLTRGPETALWEISPVKSTSRQIDWNGQTGDLAPGSLSEILLPPANAHEGLVRGKSARSGCFQF